jgi:hypothetical protein
LFILLRAQNHQIEDDEDQEHQYEKSRSPKGRLVGGGIFGIARDFLRVGCQQQYSVKEFGIQETISLKRVDAISR